MHRENERERSVHTYTHARDQGIKTKDVPNDKVTRLSIMRTSDTSLFDRFVYIFDVLSISFETMVRSNVVVGPLTLNSSKVVHSLNHHASWFPRTTSCPVSGYQSGATRIFAMIDETWIADVWFAVCDNRWNEYLPGVKRTWSRRGYNTLVGEPRRYFLNAVYLYSILEFVENPRYRWIFATLTTLGFINSNGSPKTCPSVVCWPCSGRASARLEFRKMKWKRGRRK